MALIMAVAFFAVLGLVASRDAGTRLAVGSPIACSLIFAARLGAELFAVRLEITDLSFIAVPILVAWDFRTALMGLEVAVALFAVARLLAALGGFALAAVLIVTE